MLPSMHVILDVTEDMLRESCSKTEDWERIERQLYMPTPGDTRAEGWTGEDQLSSFDALMSAL